MGEWSPIRRAFLHGGQYKSESVSRQVSNKTSQINNSLFMVKIRSQNDLASGTSNYREGRPFGRLGSKIDSTIAPVWINFSKICVVVDGQGKM